MRFRATISRVHVGGGMVLYDEFIFLLFIYYYCAHIYLGAICIHSLLVFTLHVIHSPLLPIPAPYQAPHPQSGLSDVIYWAVQTTEIVSIV